MIHPYVELKWVNESIGQGLFATRFIPRGTIMWTRHNTHKKLSYDDVRIKTREQIDHILHAAYVDADGFINCSEDLDCYANHCCNPTNYYLMPDYSIAVRNINVGEEITYDYGILNILSELTCLCGVKNCRKIITHRDVLEYATQWDQLIAQTLPYVKQVSQPLSEYILDQNQYKQIIENQLPRSSFRNYYCPEEKHQQLRTLL